MLRTDALLEVDTHKPYPHESHRMILNLATGVQAFTSNAFLVTGDRPVLVDTGSNFDINSRITDQTTDLNAIILTHPHSDHIGNIPAVRDAFDVEVWGYDARHPDVDHEIPDGEHVTIGNHTYVALHTPGHKNDHLCFYSSDANVLFTGDLVFQNGSFGRTDLDEGDRDKLINSIERVLDTVTDDLEELHSGHGPSVTTNPYSHIELALRFAQTM